MYVNGMPVRTFIYGLEKAVAYFHGDCAFSYVVDSRIVLERIVLNDAYCLLIGAENVDMLESTDETGGMIRLADDVALEQQSLTLLRGKGIHTEDISAAALLTALESHRDSDDRIEMKYHRRLQRMEMYVGERAVMV